MKKFLVLCFILSILLIPINSLAIETIVFPTTGMPMAYEKLTTASATGLTAAKYNNSSFAESLTNGALTSGTGWTDSAADFVYSTNTIVYTHSAGAGTVTQAVTALGLTGRSGKSYTFTYTVSSPSGTAPTIVITTAFASASTALTGLDAAGTYSVTFNAAATPGAFILSGTSGAAGAVTLDDLSLVENTSTDNLTNPFAALITVETAGINFTVDGSTPTVTSATSNTGHYMESGQSYVLKNITEIKKFKCINAVASSGAVIKVTYYY